MAEPNGKIPLRELLSRMKTRRTRSAMLRPQIVNLPDAVNETLRASGALLRQEAVKRDIEFRLRDQLRRLEAKKNGRMLYRARKKAERQQAIERGEQPILSLPVEWMSDAAVDAAMEQERREAQWRANLPQIGPANPVWDYPAETRRALGYYTQEEREQAARLNDMRSNTIFGNVMPNFGRQAAYNNPGAEMEAFRGTATYLPNAVIAGMGFNLPSATTAATTGLRAGWLTAKAAGANLGQRATTAVTTATRQVAPVVTNPRWAATTAAVVTPMAAAANDGAEQSGGFWNWVADHPMESMFIGALAYKGGKGLWNKGMGKFRIPAEPTEGRPARFTEAAPERGVGEWTYNPAEYPPTMRREPALDDYRITIEPPSQPRPAAFAEVEPPRPTGLRPKKKGKAAQWDALNQAHLDWEARRAQYDADNAELNRQWDEYEQAQYGPTLYDYARFQADHDDWLHTAQSDYDAAMQRHQADVADYNAEQARLDQEYNDAVEGYNLRRTANEQAWNAYHESDPYKQWLERKNGVLNFRTKAWNRVKNNWYWAVPGGVMGYKWFTGGYSGQLNNPTNNPNGDTAPNDSTLTAEPDSVIVRPFISVTPDGRVVTPSSTGTGNDTIVPMNYQTQQFDD